MNRFQQTASIVNKLVTPVLRLPGLRSVLGRSIMVLRYTGRTSGKAFELPVGYRRDGGDIVVGVAMPDKKSWWRNFTGEGGRVTMVIDGTTRTGHAISRRDDKGQVLVRIAVDTDS
ncbi:nitroreductase/quinone reductase family protein [Gordonia sp. SL306]|uniref:nitroreductase/quinone reductase family protein n=1 Tax=Gordonia sp. SL306 TaxID=2995145 RepID=UPI00226F622A|nr:nitroreductase/quinone reductase family protein [Gordonia sp. SL306]WAC55455.1 nitroreductase/quinone reductase family protein [Gordonia sp. SL306]